MSDFSHCLLRRAVAVAALSMLSCGLVPMAHAQAGSSDAKSRISAVQLYPGSATIERTLAVAPGVEQAQFACLPAGLDATQLQARGSDGVQVGDISVRQQPRRLLGQACTNPLQERVAALQQQLAEHEDETTAIDYATGFLKNFAQGEPTGAAVAPEQITAAAQALRQSGQQLLKQRSTLVREQEKLQDELDALLAERDRDGGVDALVSVVRVRLYAPMGGRLALRYQVRGPSWQPAYRADLDTEAGQVQLTRLAQVTQATGEDWSDVPITLSTGQPAAAAEGPLPRPWRLDLQDEQPERPTAALARKAAPTPMAAESVALGQGYAAAEPQFDVAVFEGAFATEFKVPQPVTVATGGASVTLTLDEQQLSASWLARIAPAVDDHAYVVAEVKVPTGVWPSGAVALYRDGAFVGQGRFDPNRIKNNGLAFGRDEQIRVRSERPERQRGTQGLIGSRNQRVDERRYSVENRHDKAVAIQVLDAAPISQNNVVKVQSDYKPAVQEGDWQEQRGTVFWQQDLAAGATQQFEATHTISWPRDDRLLER